MTQRKSLLYTQKPQPTRAFRDFLLWKPFEFWRCQRFLTRRCVLPSGREGTKRLTLHNTLKRKMWKFMKPYGKCLHAHFCEIGFCPHQGGRQRIFCLINGLQKRMLAMGIIFSRIGEGICRKQNPSRYLWEGKGRSKWSPHTINYEMGNKIVMNNYWQAHSGVV